MKINDFEKIRESSVVKVLFREAKNIKINDSYWLLVKRDWFGKYGKAKVYRIVKKAESHNGLWS